MRKSSLNAFFAAVALIASTALFAAEPANVYKHTTLKRTITVALDADGKKADLKKRLFDKKWIFVYFSANWCPSCRYFTPDFVKFYKENGGGKDFEVVFVSCDREEKDMKTYIASYEMPWLSADWDSSVEKNLKKRFLFRKDGSYGVPKLLLFDDKDDTVSSSTVGTEFVGCQKVLDDYLKLVKEDKEKAEAEAAKKLAEAAKKEAALQAKAKPAEAAKTNASGETKPAVKTPEKQTDKIDRPHSDDDGLVPDVISSK